MFKGLVIFQSFEEERNLHCGLCASVCDKRKDLHRSMTNTLVIEQTTGLFCTCVGKQSPLLITLN